MAASSLVAGLVKGDIAHLDHGSGGVRQDHFDDAADDDAERPSYDDAAYAGSGGAALLSRYAKTVGDTYNTGYDGQKADNGERLDG